MEVLSHVGHELSARRGYDASVKQTGAGWEEAGRGRESRPRLVGTTSSDRVRRLAVFSQDHAWGHVSSPIRPGDRYYVEGPLEELERAGEWLDLPVFPDTLRLATKGPLAAPSSYSPPPDRARYGVPDAPRFTFVHGEAVLQGVALHRSPAGPSGGAGEPPPWAWSRGRVVGNDIFDVGSHRDLPRAADRVSLKSAIMSRTTITLHHIGVLTGAWASPSMVSQLCVAQPDPGRLADGHHVQRLPSSSTPHGTRDRNTRAVYTGAG